MVVAPVFFFLSQPCFQIHISGWKLVCGSPSASIFFKLYWWLVLSWLNANLKSLANLQLFSSVNWSTLVGVQIKHGTCSAFILFKLLENVIGLNPSIFFFYSCGTR